MTTWQRSKDKDPAYEAKPTTHASAMHDLEMVLTLTSQGKRTMLYFVSYYMVVADIAGGTDMYTLSFVKT